MAELPDAAPEALQALVASLVADGASFELDQSSGGFSIWTLRIWDLVLWLRQEYSGWLLTLEAEGIPEMPVSFWRQAQAGTTDLFAALNVGTGEVLTDCCKRHAAADVLRFFKLIDLHVARDLEIHVVLDNLSAHKAPEITKWLEDPKRARWHLHFIPTSSSWLNLVERWFKELTDRRLRRGAFNSVPDLIDAIEAWVEHWNDDPKPFIWHKTAEDIIAKVRRGRAALAQAKSATQH